MKKHISLNLLLLFVFVLAGCHNKSINYIISNEPNLSGIIIETNDTSILVENAEGEYLVSLDVGNNDGLYSPMMIGDEVTVYYDGNIAESYPMQINRVYAILLLEPADRSVNDIS